jgi:hypothetical protein
MQKSIAAREGNIPLVNTQRIRNKKCGYKTINLMFVKRVISRYHSSEQESRSNCSGLFFRKDKKNFNTAELAENSSLSERKASEKRRE